MKDGLSFEYIQTYQEGPGFIPYEIWTLSEGVDWTYQIIIWRDAGLLYFGMSQYCWKSRYLSTHK